MTANPNKKRSDDTWALVDYYLQPISSYFEMDGVSEICINRFDDVYVERFGKMEPVAAKFDSEETLATALKQIANALGQVCDQNTHPILDARLKDGSRVCGVLFPTAPLGTCISIRVFPKTRLNAQDLLEKGSYSEEMLEYFRVATMVRSNMLVSGGTGSGKTTLLNVLSSFIPTEDRVITVEDTLELQVDVENLVALEAPQVRRMAKDAQNVNMERLIRTTLRMKPTRIIVGEIRDAGAAVAFLLGINTGHSGTCSTIHANSPVDALIRMQTLIAGEGSLPFDVVQQQVRSNLHVLIQAESTPNHGKRVVEIVELREGEPTSLWRWDYVKGVHQLDEQALSESVVLAKAKRFGIESTLI
ncbi:MAG: CpaF family protein [Gammaproteobacteria bacterium]|nr:CpaF family protein [Gammaproteobacteria bacterium]